MTKNTLPRLNPSWMPVSEGVDLMVENRSFKMPMSDVRELRDDMEEAVMLARGYDKLEDEVQNADAGDVFWLFGYYVQIRDTLLMGDLANGDEGLEVEFEAISHDLKGCVTLSKTTEVTLYRKII